MTQLRLRVEALEGAPYVYSTADADSLNSFPNAVVLTAGSGIALGQLGQVLTISATGGAGTVTSVNASGGSTGLTFSGGPITGAGTLTLGGTLALANGGTGATTASAARTNLGLGALATLAALTNDTQHGNRGGGALHSVATTSVNGFMSAADKSKLDSLASPSSAMSALGANYSVAANTSWQAVGPSFVLGAGTYCISAIVCFACVLNTGSTRVRFFNITSGAGIADSETVLSDAATNGAMVGSASLSSIVTLMSSQSIRLEVQQSAAPGLGSSTIYGSAGIGITRMIYFRLA